MAKKGLNPPKSETIVETWCYSFLCISFSPVIIGACKGFFQSTWGTQEQGIFIYLLVSNRLPDQTKTIDTENLIQPLLMSIPVSKNSIFFRKSDPDGRKHRKTVTPHHLDWRVFFYSHNPLSLSNWFFSHNGSKAFVGQCAALSNRSE